MVRRWHGGFEEFVTGMAIRELAASGCLAMLFMNVRRLSGVPGSVREWRRFVGRIEHNKFSPVRPPPKPSSEAFLPFKATLKVLMYGVKVKFLISTFKKNQKNESWYYGDA